MVRFVVLPFERWRHMYLTSATLSRRERVRQLPAGDAAVDLTAIQVRFGSYLALSLGSDLGNHEQIDLGPGRCHRSETESSDKRQYWFTHEYEAFCNCQVSVRRLPDSLTHDTTFRRHHPGSLFTNRKETPDSRERKVSRRS